MQSPTQTISDPNPVTATCATMEQPLESNTGTKPVQTKTDAQVMDKKSDKTKITTQQNEAGVQTTETPTGVAVTQSVGNKPAPPDHTDNTGGMVRDSSAPMKSAPATKPNPGSDVQQAKKQDKGPKKYIPSKKAMLDPLKIDMSKAVVMPLTCEYLSFSV